MESSLSGSFGAVKSDMHVSHSGSFSNKSSNDGIVNSRREYFSGIYVLMRAWRKTNSREAKMLEGKAHPSSCREWMREDEETALTNSLLRR